MFCVVVVVVGCAAHKIYISYFNDKSFGARKSADFLFAAEIVK